MASNHNSTSMDTERKMSGKDVDISLNDRLLVLTREMLATAQANEWEKLAELEQIRRPIFMRVFAQVTADNEALAREVLNIDEETRTLAEAGQPALQQEILKRQNSVKANRAYQNIQNSAVNTE